MFGNGLFGCGRWFDGFGGCCFGGFGGFFFSWFDDFFDCDEFVGCGCCCESFCDWDC